MLDSYEFLNFEGDNALLPRLLLRGLRSVSLRGDGLEIEKLPCEHGHDGMLQNVIERDALPGVRPLGDRQASAVPEFVQSF